MSVAHTQNSTFKLNCSNDPLFAGQGANITTGVAYGSGNAGSILIDLNQDSTITTNFTGTVTGILRNTIGGAEVDFSGSTFTIASGCGTPGSLTGTPTTGSFTAGQTSCSPVINLPTAAHGWWCNAVDITHPADLFTQTAKSTTSCTLSATVTSADVILFNATPY